MIPGLALRRRFCHEAYRSTRSSSESAVHYANADVFVFPSFYDAWGLVVNEALLAGLYTLSSRIAGATADLITNAPENVGRSFAPGNQAEFSILLQETLSSWPVTPREKISAWGSRHTTEEYAGKVYQALLLASGKSGGEKVP